MIMVKPEFKMRRFSPLKTRVKKPKTKGTKADSVSTGLIHPDSLALAGDGTPVVTFHRERKKRSCTCLLISKVTYWYFLIFAVLPNMIHMDSCTLFSG